MAIQGGRGLDTGSFQGYKIFAKWLTLAYKYAAQSKYINKTKTK